MKAICLMEALTDIDIEFIENATQQMKTRRHSFGKILLIAAVIMALATTVFALSEKNNWFIDYFSKPNVELSEEQIDYIENNTIETPQVQTIDGYTIAVESTLSDGRSGIIKLTLTAPESVDLDADWFSWGNVDYLTPPEGERNTITSLSWDSQRREDQENVVDIVITVYGDISDKGRWTLRFKDLYANYLKDMNNEDIYSGSKLLARGVWRFDIVFSVNGNLELELIKEPIKQIVDLSLDKPNYVSVLVTSIKLRAMSMDLCYEYLEPSDTVGTLDRVYAVMKDGSQVFIGARSASPGKITYAFPYPIVLSEVDHLLFSDGTKLPILK